MYHEWTESCIMNESGHEHDALVDAGHTHETIVIW